MDLFAFEITHIVASCAYNSVHIFHVLIKKIS